jgi:hypothetical protein
LPSVTSTVPAVLERLVALARAALPDVEIWDGQPVRDVADEVLLIGFNGEPGEESVIDTRARQGLSPDPDRENYEITCLASSWKGRVDDMQPVRERAYELVDAFNLELMRDPRLGDRVLSSRVSAVGMTQMQTEDGAVATVRFVVIVSAFTR